MEVVHGDILLQEIEDLPIDEPVRIIGNIPYNITSPIIFWLIEQLDYWDDAYIMMQKEVADRLNAVVNTKAYGRLTVVVGAYLDVDICFTIKPDVFIPKPKVDSAVISMTRKKNINLNCDINLLDKVIKLSFQQRRKKLKNSLKKLDIQENILEDSIFGLRPEQLSVEEFVKLTQKISDETI